jgi:spore maturation protein CgeB
MTAPLVRPAPLEIAFFGSSLVSAYWNGAATYYRGMIRALAGRGHRVTFYEPDAYERQRHRDIPDPDWARVVVYPGEGEEGVHRALARARGADLVVKASGVGVFDTLLEREVLALRGPSTLVAFWDVDAPATLDRVHGDGADPFRPLIPRYDLVLTYGGGPPVVDAYTALGARRCVPIYNALDPSTHYPAAPDPRFAGTLGFLGNRLPDREARVEEFFLRAAAALPGERFLLGGSGWDDKQAPPNVERLGHVYTHEHNAFNATPRAVLNVNRESMARYGFSPPTRVFEAAGAAACLVSDAWTGLETFLEPDREVLVARDGEEVAEHVRSLTPVRARAIGDAAFAHVTAEHTYAHRAAQLEEVLGVGRARPRASMDALVPRPEMASPEVEACARSRRGGSTSSSWGCRSHRRGVTGTRRRIVASCASSCAAGIACSSSSAMCRGMPGIATCRIRRTDGPCCTPTCASSVRVTRAPCARPTWSSSARTCPRARTWGRGSRARRAG